MSIYYALLTWLGIFDILLLNVQTGLNPLKFCNYKSLIKFGTLILGRGGKMLLGGFFQKVKSISPDEVREVIKKKSAQGVPFSAFQ